MIATTRKPEEAHRLRAIADANDNVVVELLDVTNGSHVSDLARKYEGQPIDVLVNNAGATGDFVGPSQAFGSLDHEELDNLMSVNGFGPLRVTEAFYENVRMSKQKKVIAITALLGVHSFGYGRFSGGYGYKLSKATLNAAMAILAGEAEEDGVIVALLTPGEVAVEKVKNPGPRFIEPDVSISGMIEVIDSLTLEDTGTIIRYNGKRYDF